MARRKRKKQSFSKNLKYEIYGILLITSSILALSGVGPFGRVLSMLFGFMLGKFYFFIPLTLIYSGLSVMIRRNWQLSWNPRISGIACILVALTLISTIAAANEVIVRHTPVMQGELSAGKIFSEVNKDMLAELWKPVHTGTVSDMLHKNISGGYIGLLAYCFLYALFGSLGTKLVTIVLLFIGFMLSTQLSYVELVRLIRTQMKKIYSAFMKKRKARLNERRLEEGTRPARKSEREPIPDFSEDDDEYGPPKKGYKTPVFFQLFNMKRTLERGQDMEDANDDWEAPEAKPSRRRRRDDSQDADWHEFHEEQGPTASVSNPTATNVNARRSAALAAGGAHLTSAISDAQHEGPVFHDFTAEAHQSSWDQQDHTIPGQDDIDDDWSAQPIIPNPHAQALGDIPVVLEEELEGMGLDNNISSAVDQQEGLSLETEGTDQVESTPVEPPKPPVKPYKLPSFQLLSKPQGSGKGGDQADFMQTARKLEATLESFGVRAKVLQVVRGPAVTRYEIQPDIGVKVSRIVSLTDDIALALAAKDIRMEAPIPGKSAIGIEVPNNDVSIVTMREVMETPTFVDAASRITISLGRDIAGTPIIGNLARMPHLLVAGATGSGKSVCINGIITSILYKAKPDEVKFLMVDPKMVELNVYNGIPHLLAPVVTDPKRASLALKKIVVEMEKRYELFSKSGTRNIEGYNKHVEADKDKVLPYIVVIVDELADLMMVAANDVEDAICRLAQMARAAGIHLIIATQRPSVDVITGVIKANIPSRIAFGVSSQVDSRTILDMAGAEKLLGRGDMLYLPMGSSKPIRVQGAFLSDEEVEAVVSYCSDQAAANYDEGLVPEVDENGMAADEPVDDLYEQAVQIVLEGQQASASLLQRRLRVGYNRASRLIEFMQMQGIIGPPDGSRPREVLVTLEQYQQAKISS
ncbi:DNA translocase FtsK [Paenibacillus sp. UMB4589-SE434]|uniref:FtsK/SpoIIIE family DNA translocase n=1 Tax=Paenibacillus sp. UMB4589-SE434 TaxID=3046314 RepID=UPI00254F1D4F|nr:DNA translocase FtsK [Paenibacillus sp. UMB4589-SE434]MDK8180667.1 DNA translocase FtsK 4TM domain-containing protein [Paenibacillus sp. UMB4589-SE434]